MEKMGYRVVIYQRSLERFIGLLVPVGWLGFKSSKQATEAWKEVGEDTTSTRCRCCGCLGKPFELEKH